MRARRLPEPPVARGTSAIHSRVEQLAQRRVEGAVGQRPEGAEGGVEAFAQLVAVHRALVEQAEDGELEQLGASRHRGHLLHGSDGARPDILGLCPVRTVTQIYRHDTSADTHTIGTGGLRPRILVRRECSDPRQPRCAARPRRVRSRGARRRIRRRPRRRARRRTRRAEAPVPRPQGHQVGALHPAQPHRARCGRRRHRLRHDPAAPAQRAGQRAGLDRLLRRRQDRAGPALRGRGQPRVGAALEGPRPRPEGRARRGGPRLLHQPRLLPDRHRPLGLAGAARVRRPGRRLDDHPAVREELLPHVGPLADPEVQGDHHLRQDRPAAGQGPDPRELPQHDLLRPRRLRHPDRVQGVLQQGRQPADAWPRGPPSRRSSTRRRSTTRPWATSRRPTSRAGWPTSSTAWSPRAG